MAKINNQAIIQKLIDELTLYPGKDLIPSELADKVLAVFQVNSQDVNVSVVSNSKMFVDSTPNVNDKTITVPIGKKWQIQHIMVKYVCTATVGSRAMRFIIKDDTGEIMWTLQALTSMTASQTVFNAFVPGAWATNDDIEINMMAQSFVYPLSDRMVLLGGWTLQLLDINDVDDADDMIFTIQADEGTT